LLVYSSRDYPKSEKCPSPVCQGHIDPGDARAAAGRDGDGAGDDAGDGFLYGFPPPGGAAREGGCREVLAGRGIMTLAVGGLETWGLPAVVMIVPRNNYRSSSLLQTHHDDENDHSSNNGVRLLIDI
jgi:hypothetical protein